MFAFRIGGLVIIWLLVIWTRFVMGYNIGSFEWFAWLLVAHAITTAIGWLARGEYEDRKHHGGN